MIRGNSDSDSSVMNGQPSPPASPIPNSSLHHLQNLSARLVERWASPPIPSRSPGERLSPLPLSPEARSDGAPTSSVPAAALEPGNWGHLVPVHFEALADVAAFDAELVADAARADAAFDAKLVADSARAILDDDERGDEGRPLDAEPADGGLIESDKDDEDENDVDGGLINESDESDDDGEDDDDDVDTEDCEETQRRGWRSHSFTRTLSLAERRRLCGGPPTCKRPASEAPPTCKRPASEGWALNAELAARLRAVMPRIRADFHPNVHRRPAASPPAADGEPNDVETHGVPQDMEALPAAARKKPAADGEPNNVEALPAAAPAAAHKPASQPRPTRKPNDVEALPAAARGRSRKRPASEPASEPAARGPSRRRLHGKQPHATPAALDSSLAQQATLSQFMLLAQQAGFSSHEAKLLHLCAIPVTLLLLCMGARAVDCPQCYCIELFAGVAAIARAFIAQGFFALTFDKDHSQDQDMNTWSGFMIVLAWALRAEPGGIIWMGTVCSTWVVTSRGSTGRSQSCVLGAQRHWTVSEANKMAARSALVAYICAVRGVGFILEQPQTSLMVDMPCFRFLMELSQVIHGWVWATQRTCLGAFGAERPKPINMYSNRNWVSHLERSVSGLSFVSCEDAGVVKEVIGSDGSRKFAGGPNLKETQEYPLEFGVQVQRCWAEHDCTEYLRHIASVYSPADIEGLVATVPPQWELARLQDCLQEAQMATDGS